MLFLGKKQRCKSLATYIYTFGHFEWFLVVTDSKLFIFPFLFCGVIYTASCNTVSLITFECVTPFFWNVWKLFRHRMHRGNNLKFYWVIKLHILTVEGNISYESIWFLINVFILSKSVRVYLEKMKNLLKISLYVVNICYIENRDCIFTE